MPLIPVALQSGKNLVMNATYMEAHTCHRRRHLRIANALVILWASLPSIALAIEPTNTTPRWTWNRQTWSASLQGFIEADAIWDSTQSYSDLAGNVAIARPRTYAGDHSRFTLGARNSRVNGQFYYTGEPFKSRARLELDFLGNQPTGVSESAFFENIAPRVRHAYATLEFAHVELLAGQTWQLLGSQPMPQVNTILIPGAPGVLIGRAPQLRAQGKETFERLQLGWAAAASRPPARDAGAPDGEFAIRFADLGWQGIHTVAGMYSEAMPATLGLSGVLRSLAAPHDAAPSAREDRALGYGWSVDAFLPIVGNTETRGNNLSLAASYVGGAGIADLFTGLSGGAPAVGTLDAGLVGVDANGRLRPIDWQVVLASLQYYLPPEGQFWFVLSGSYMTSKNIRAFAKPNAAFKESWWVDVNIMAEVVDSVRVGLDVSCMWQRYLDDVIARNLRGQVSVFYFF